MCDEQSSLVAEKDTTNTSNQHLRLTEEKMFRYAMQIAKGMEYLTDRKVWAYAVICLAILIMILLWCDVDTSP